MSLDMEGSSRSSAVGGEPVPAGIPLQPGLGLGEGMPSLLLVGVGPQDPDRALARDPFLPAAATRREDSAASAPAEPGAVRLRSRAHRSS